jgi:hypothetical protein
VVGVGVDVLGHDLDCASNLCPEGTQLVALILLVVMPKILAHSLRVAAVVAVGVALNARN